jgi:hypothetical protein
MSDAFDRADAAGKLNATLNATQAIDAANALIGGVIPGFNAMQAAAHIVATIDVSQVVAGLTSIAGLFIPGLDFLGPLAALGAKIATTPISSSGPGWRQRRRSSHQRRRVHDPGQQRRRNADYTDQGDGVEASRVRQVHADRLHQVVEPAGRAGEAGVRCCRCLSGRVEEAAAGSREGVPASGEGLPRGRPCTRRREPAAGAGT